MSKVIKIKKGLDIKLVGAAEKKRLPVFEHSSVFAVSPGDFHGIHPKLSVKEGDEVKAGTTLFVDKNRPEIRFVSPVSGEVIAIERGEKRKLLRLLIQAKASKYEDFGKKDVSTSSTQEIKELLLQAGNWPFIKQRPYDVIANPVDTPRDLFVSAFDSAPLSPDMNFVLDGQEDDFQTGLNALTRLTSGNVYVGIPARTAIPALRQMKNVETVEFDGPHPAGNVGVQIHHIKPVNKGEVVWTIHAADVLFIGRLFNKGIADFTRTVAITGSEVTERQYVDLLPGASLEGIVKTTKGKNLRYISGNVLTGKQIDANGFLGYYDSQVTVIPEGTEKHDMLGWISPGFSKYSVNRSFISWFLNKLNFDRKYVLDARIKGGKRAIILSNEYDSVFPMDILPEFLLKATIAFDIDKMEQLGIYEVAPEDFALCEFVDTSKLEIQQIIRDALDKLRLEMN
ncbi:MAG: Na(+)-translocating NADH-quinone reductase subunit A [Bacteroidales bacterium]|jgi:Na+-transporting NADH:ubiquinone oxidoreductase subunit A|nr:Na(+)-translocating NADH-quinone reductase subunit A [Bacteroidales bacterium]